MDAQSPSRLHESTERIASQGQAFLYTIRAVVA
jgi:hypothetical protein